MAHQNEIFTDPWKTRAWFAVDETWPKVDEVKTPAPPVVAPVVPVVPPVGMLKFGWFKTLKASRRNVEVSRSLIGNTREIWASNW